MSDLLLIQPPVSFDNIIKGGYDEVPHLGMLYLAAVLEKNKIPVHVLDILDASMGVNEIVNFVKENNVSIVGISATTPQIKSAVEIAKAIKSNFGDDVYVCIGGCHVSADPKLIERYPYFDFCVIGEGEITFLELVQKILRGEKVSGVFQGVPVENLDDIPFPAFHLIDLDKYIKKGLDAYPIILTRGCPYKCIFCSRKGLSNSVRSRSAQNVCDEIEQWSEFFNGKFQFLDDSFCTYKKNVLDFCDEVIRRKLKVQWWAGGTRFNQIDQNLIEKMVRSGCTGFCLGVESGSERVRNHVVKKGITDKMIFEGLKILKGFSIGIQLSFVMGLPTETREEMMQTAMFPRKLLDSGFTNIDIVAITPTVPLPGAKLFDESVKEGKFDVSIIDQFIKGELGDGFRDNWPIYVPDGVTKDELLEIRRKGYFSFYFSRKYIWKRFKEDIFSYKRLKKDILEVISLLRSGRSRASFS